MKTIDLKKYLQILSRNKYVLLLLCLGLLLLMLPTSPKSGEKAHSADPLEATGVSLEDENEKLAALLQSTAGVGRAQVLLSAKGAIVACDGAETAKVKLTVTEAVMAYTGLPSTKISVIKLK